MSALGDALYRRWRALPDAEQVHVHGLLLCGALFLVHYALYSWWFIEDAAITFAYARNAAVGEGFVAYPGGDPVEGFSNPSWTLLLAFMRLLGVSPWLASKALGAVLGLATLPLAWLWTRRIMGPDAGRWPLLAPLLLATTPQHALWCASGLENPLFGVLLAAGGLLLVREIEDEAPPWSALPWFGLAITRPESPMYAAIAAAIALVLIAGRRGVRGAWSWAWRWGLLFAVPFAAWHAVRIGYFAWEFPNTYYAKLAEEARFQPMKWGSRGWDYLRKWALPTTQGFLIPVYLFGQTGRGKGRGVAGALLIAVAVLLLLPGASWPWQILPLPSFKEPEWFVAVRVAAIATMVIAAPGVGVERDGAAGRVLAWFLMVTGLFFALYTGGDWMKGWRWINPVVVPLAVLFTDGLREITEALAAGRLRRIAVPTRFALAAAPVVAGVILAGARVGDPETTPYDVRRRVVYMQNVAARVDLEHPTQMEVDLGAQMWWSGFRLVDMAGLVDVPMAHHHWEKAFVRQYVYDERRPDFAHVHGFWAKKTHMTDHPPWRGYLEIPAVPISPGQTHTGNHVRRDLVFASRWPGGRERRTEFDGRLVLEGVDTPVTEVGAGGALYVQVGWRRKGAGSPFRAWLFLVGDAGQQAWELPPGNDWTEPVTWRPTDVVLGRHRLPIDLPPGRYDVGIVVLTEGAEAYVLGPTVLPDSAATDAARFAVGEVRWSDVIEVQAPDAFEATLDADVAEALAAAEHSDCGAADDAWMHLRRRLAWFDPRVDDARARVAGPIARCYAAWAEALDPIDAVGPLQQARRWDHRDPFVRGAARRVADALVAEGDRAEARGDPAAAYAAWTDALAIDPSRTWVRRRAEAARDVTLGLEEPGSAAASGGSG